MARHDQVIQGLVGAEPRLQRLVAELIMIRLFDEFQEAIAGVALRLACGTRYADGTAPALLTTPARSTAGAFQLFENFGRPKPRSPKWSRAGFISETTRYVLDRTDTFCAVCNAHGGVIAEMQAVRNRIAHANANSRAAYALVVMRHYGAPLNHVSPGVLLRSPRFSPPLLERYVAACRVIARDCARA
jgi:hypothetical protein